MSVLTKSYSIVRDNHMQSPKKNLEWFNPRLHYITSITKPLPDTCPECNTHELEYDETHAQTYCITCGLIIREPIPYVGLERITYPTK